MREMSIHAKTAKAIRTELKINFPGVKFSVKSECFSGGNSVKVDWIDGPGKDKVNAITSKYQYGHFNAMEDMYENSNEKSELPQVKYVQIFREWSEKTLDTLKKYVRSYYVNWENVSDHEYNQYWNNSITGFIWEKFNNLDMSEIIKKIEVESVEKGSVVADILTNYRSKSARLLLQSEK